MPQNDRRPASAKILFRLQMSREPSVNTQLQASRRLWFSSYHGVLSSHSVAVPGYPFGSLVLICRDYDGLPLLLLSHLAQHTQNLLDNPNCSLTLLETGSGDVQQLGRLTCLARMATVKPVTEGSSQRYFRYFPNTREYYENLNFQFYKLTPERFHFVGGFGAARWIDPSRLLPDFTLTANEEAELLVQLQSHPLFTASNGIHISPVGIDSLGLDLKSNNQLTRVMLDEPVTSSSQALEMLGRALNQDSELFDSRSKHHS